MIIIVDSEVWGTTLQKLIVDNEVRGTIRQKLIVATQYNTCKVNRRRVE